MDNNHMTANDLSKITDVSVSSIRNYLSEKKLSQQFLHSLRNHLDEDDSSPVVSQSVESATVYIDSWQTTFT